MSASEKLKTLDETMSNARWSLKRYPNRTILDCDDRAINALDKELAISLRNALPQIVAVVEAAEVQATLPGLCDDLRAALAALGEALT